MHFTQVFIFKNFSCQIMLMVLVKQLRHYTPQGLKGVVLKIADKEVYFQKIAVYRSRKRHLNVLGYSIPISLQFTARTFQVFFFQKSSELSVLG